MKEFWKKPYKREKNILKKFHTFFLFFCIFFALSPLLKSPPQPVPKAFLLIALRHPEGPLGGLGLLQGLLLRPGEIGLGLPRDKLGVHFPLLHLAGIQHTCLLPSNVRNRLHLYDTTMLRRPQEPAAESCQRITS